MTAYRTPALVEPPDSTPSQRDPRPLVYRSCGWCRPCNDMRMHGSPDHPKPGLASYLKCEDCGLELNVRWA